MSERLSEGGLDRVDDWRIEVVEDLKVQDLYRARAFGPHGEVVEDFAPTVFRDDAIPNARRTLARRFEAAADRETRSRALVEFDAEWLGRIRTFAPSERIDALIEATDRLMVQSPADASFLSHLRDILTGWHSTLDGQPGDWSFALFRTLSDDADLLGSLYGTGLMSLLDARTEGPASSDIQRR